MELRKKRGTWSIMVGRLFWHYPKKLTKRRGWSFVYKRDAQRDAKHCPFSEARLVHTNLTKGQTYADYGKSKEE